MTEAGPANEAAAFGIDAFALDDRMRLFHFLAAEKRTAYLWILRAFDRARANYQVLLHTADVAAQLAELAAEHPECPRTRRPRRRAGRAGGLGEPGPRAGRRPRRHRAGVPQPALGLPADATPATAPTRPSSRCSRRGWTTPTCPGWCSPTSSPTCTRSPPPRRRGRRRGGLPEADAARPRAGGHGRAGRAVLPAARRAGPHHATTAPRCSWRTRTRCSRTCASSTPSCCATARGCTRRRSPSRPPGSSGCWSWPRRPTTGCSARLPRGWPTGGSAGPGWWRGSGRRGRPRSPIGCSRPRSRRSATSSRCCAGSPRPGGAV